MKSRNTEITRWGLHNRSQMYRYRRFALKYLATFNGIDSYISVYPNASRKAAKRKAYELLKHPYVNHVMINKNRELEEKMDNQIIMNRERILEELEDILNKTKDLEQYSSALKALDQVSKRVGAYAPEKSEVTHKGITLNYILPEDKEEEGEDEE